MADAGSRPVRIRAPQLIAHRGYPLHYPENSIAGMRAALDAGAAAVECDVQLSGDRRPMVIHDASLQRTADIEGNVSDMTVAELARVEVNETERFGGRFRGTRIPELQEVVELARSHSGVTFFIEAKRASIRRFGQEAVLDALLAELRSTTTPWVLLSFDGSFVELSRARRVPRVGWVLEQWEQVAQGTVQALAPDFVFCNARKVPAGARLPAGSWQWVVYGINEPEAALDYIDRGADFIATDAIREMLAALCPRYERSPPQS